MSLFDLEDDPGEQHDVAARYPDIVARLKRSSIRPWRIIKAGRGEDRSDQDERRGLSCSVGWAPPTDASPIRLASLVDSKKPCQTTVVSTFQAEPTS